MDPSKREIPAINTSLPLQQFMKEVNTALAHVEGIAKSFNHTFFELDQMRSGLGLDRYYQTRQAIGNSDADYQNWTVHSTENGYNIWKYPVPDYTYDPNNSLRKDGIVCDFMGEAVTDGSDQFDTVYILSGGQLTDHTAEAGTDEGSPISLLGATPEELLIGHSSIFSGLDLTNYTPGSGYALSYQTSTPTGWNSGAMLRDDPTNNWRRDGLTRINPPGNWAVQDINGQSKYWLKIKTSTVPTQRAQAYAIQPATNPRNMLSLSAEQIQKQGMTRWCSFGNTIFTTVRNQGDLRYHGNLHLRSGASSVERKAYFSVNHRFEADYKKNSYVPRLPSRDRLSYFDDGTAALDGRYVNIGANIGGEQGHVAIRPGYLTGIGVTAGIAPSGDDLTLVVRKNREGTIISGVILDGYNTVQKGDIDPVAFAAGDTIQVWAEPTGSSAHRDIVVDVETIEVDIG